MAATLLLVASCSESNRADDERAPDSETEEDEGSAAAGDEREAVEAAYEEASQARIDALSPPAADPADPALAETHTGPMLEQVRDVATGMQAEGLAIRYPEDSERRIDVESVEFDSDDVAILELCIVDDGERVDLQTGEVLAGGVFSGRVTAAMRRVDGRWKLAEREQGEQQEGTGACASE